MAIAQSVAQCTICTSMSRLAGRLCLPTRLFREGDQQARSINGRSWRLVQCKRPAQTKAPREGGAKLGHVGITGLACRRGLRARRQAYQLNAEPHHRLHAARGTPA